MARIPYSLIKISKKTRKKIIRLAIVTGIPSIILYLLSFFRVYNIFETNKGIGFYLLISMPCLFSVGLIVGDDSIQYGENTNYGENYNQLTSPFGIVSQIMFFLQILPPIGFIIGIVFLFGQ